MAKKELENFGTEERRLEVQLTEDEKIQAGKDLAEKVLVREDTGEIVDEKLQTEEDRQGDLPTGIGRANYKE